MTSSSSSQLKRKLLKTFKPKANGKSNCLTYSIKLTTIISKNLFIKVVKPRPTLKSPKCLIHYRLRRANSQIMIKNRLSSRSKNSCCHQASSIHIKTQNTTSYQCKGKDLPQRNSQYKRRNQEKELPRVFLLS